MEPSTSHPPPQAPPRPAGSYETLYGVSLLDDLHNYFPAILYDSSRFHSVRDLLFYFQTNMRRQFDLYSFGQNTYISSQLPMATPPRPAPSEDEDSKEEETLQTPARVGDAPEVSTPPHAPRRLRPRMDGLFNNINTIILDEYDTRLDDALHSALDMRRIQNLITVLSGVAPAQSAQYEDVEVAPTIEEIEHGTTALRVTEEDTCSVCQDVIKVDEDARRLNHCEHTFHIGCIDTWFRRNVHCPICRHDIRETTTDESTEAD